MSRCSDCGRPLKKAERGMCKVCKDFFLAQQDKVGELLGLGPDDLPAPDAGLDSEQESRLSGGDVEE